MAAPVDPEHGAIARWPGIALVADGFEGRIGGAEAVAARLARALAQRGHAVKRIAAERTLGALARARALARDAERAMGAGWFVVSLTKAPGHVAFPQGGVHLASLAGALRPYAPVLRPWVAAGRLLAPRQFVFLANEKRQHASTRLWIALSERVRTDLIAWCGVSPERIAVCRLGVDLEHFRPPSAEERRRARAALALPPGALTILFASHNERLRGLERLVRALAELVPAIPPQSLALLLCGRGRAERVAARLPQRGVAVRALGGVEDMRRCYHAADVLAHPTYYDTSSLVILEALACGLPVITTADHGGTEFLEGPEAIVLPPGRDPVPLREAIAAVRSPARRRFMGEAARRVAQRYPVEASFERLVRLIEGVQKRCDPALEPPPAAATENEA